MGTKNRIKLIAEVMAMVGLLLVLALLIIKSSYWFLGFFLMVPNTFFKVRELKKDTRQNKPDVTYQDEFTASN